MKLKDILEKCKEIAENTPKFDYRAANSLKKERIGVSFVDIEGGKEVKKYWCPLCKSTSIYSKSGEIECDACGEKISVTSPYAPIIISHLSGLARVIHVSQDFVIVESLPSSSVLWKNPYDFTDIEEAHEKRNLELKVCNDEAGYYVFGKEIGLRYVPITFSQIKKVTTNLNFSHPFVTNELLDDYKKYMESILGPKPSGYGNVLSNDLFEARKFTPTSAKSAMSAAAKAQATRESKRKEEDETARALIRNNAKDLIFSNMKGFVNAFKHSNNEYVYWCDVCGHHEIKKITPLEEEEMILYCASCGHPIKITPQVSSEAYENRYYVDIVSDNSGNLALNLYKARMRYDADNGQIIKEAEFMEEFACFEKKIQAYDSGGYRDDGLIFPYGHFKPILESDAREAIEKSRWNKYGLTMIYDHYFRDNEGGRSYDILLNYIMVLKKAPVVEQIVKCGCMDLYEWVRDNYPNQKHNYKASNIRDCFGLSKTQARLVTENKMSYKEMMHLKHLQDKDPSCTFEDYNWSCMTYRCDPAGYNDVVDAVDVSGLTVSEVKDYLTSCHYDQCIEWSEIASLWIDYLKMMDKLGFSPKEKKKEMFPRSLKKAHDILNFAARNIFDKEKAKIFDENVNEAKRFEYSFGDYLIKAPDSAEDLVREGIALNHSVGQHIEYVADGKEYILFIRTKAEPDEPLYTVELLKSDKSIVQVRGNSNRLVKEPEILNFIQKWAKFKKLSVKSF